MVRFGLYVYARAAGSVRSLFALGRSAYSTPHIDQLVNVSNVLSCCTTYFCALPPAAHQSVRVGSA